MTAAGFLSIIWLRNMGQSPGRLQVVQPTTTNAIIYDLNDRLMQSEIITDALADSNRMFRKRQAYNSHDGVGKKKVVFPVKLKNSDFLVKGVSLTRRSLYCKKKRKNISCTIPSRTDTICRKNKLFC